jgi:PAS domain S-box-containing protein
MTTNWQSPRDTLRAIGLRAGTFWRWLIEPDKAIQEPEHRRRARLLAGMLVTIILIGIWMYFIKLFYELGVSNLVTAFREDSVVYVTPVALVVCGVAYGLSRSKHYAWGAFILITNVYVAVLVVASGARVSFGVVGILSYLTLCILLGSLFLPLWSTMILYVACLLGVQMLQVFSAPAIVAYPETVVPAFNIVLLVGGSIVVAAAIREQDLRQIQQQARELVETTLDIAQRKQAAETLAEERNLLRTLIDNIPDYIFVKDTESRFIINNVAHMRSLKTSSQEELVGKMDADFVAQELAERYYADEQEIIRLARPLIDREELVVGPDGREKWLLTTRVPLRDVEGEVVGLVSISRDITQRKQLEEETLRQERLAAVGQLAAGIAHDFNNILTSIIGFADLLQRQPNVPEDFHPDLAKIVEQGQRAAQLTRQILDFSRQTVNEPRPLDLKVYLNETLKFIERTIPETIQIRFNFERGDHTINADPTQLQQVITNLAVNARDAMPGGGTLYLDLSRTSLAPDELPPCPDMETGDWIRLAVTDTGSGIAPEVLAHIFEPFFTTKEVGQGTGLGLAQIYGIVQQHGGCITVNSQVGQGATFTLYFPALTIHAPDGSEAVEAIPKGQGETILLVEDERVVQEVIQAMLERLNYRVFAARDGEEALSVCRAQAKQIALVLTDAVMPKMDGFALASVLQGEVPGMRVVLMSGYASDSEIPAETIQNITARLKKPLSLHQLAEAMREALD